MILRYILNSSCCLILALTGALVATPLQAQSESDTGGFFSSDFVVGEIKNEHTNDSSTANDDNSDKDSPKKDNPLDLQQGVKVTALGAIIGGSTPEQHFEPLVELIEFCKERNLPIGKVYSLGNYGADQTDFQKVRIHFDVLGGELLRVDKLPDKYSRVKTAATWIVYTAEGEIILEGAPKLDQFINSVGEFIEDSSAVDSLNDSQNTESISATQAQGSTAKN
jgi:hypothetical protein